MLNKYSKSVFPLKFHEYTASGKPIVTTDLPELQPYKDVIEITKDYRAFEEGIAKALSEDNEELAEKRIAIAKENSWGKKVEVMIRLIQARLKEKQTVTQ